MWTRRSFVAASLLLSAGAAFAQANLKPDTTPRLPAQPGQGLPQEDRDFLERAAGLSAAEIEVAMVGAEKAADSALKTLSTELVSDHEALLAKLREHAAKFQVQLRPEGTKKGWTDELQALSGESGEAFDKAYLGWQLQAHLALVNLYQTAASHSPESDLAKFSIITLNAIQRRFDRLKEMGARYNLKVDTVKQPPQY